VGTISAELDLLFKSRMTGLSVEDLSVKKTQPEAQPEAQPEPQHAVPSVWRELAGLCIRITIIGSVFLLLFTFVYGLHQNLDIDAAPMVKSGDLVMFYRLDKEYSIGDLVLLNFQGQRQVRRVVAKAGDTVDITENGLIVNGALQQEPNIFENTWAYENGPAFPLTIGANQVFVLGDARENATDSRVYGPVNQSDTLGTVITVIRRRNL